MKKAWTSLLILLLLCGVSSADDATVLQQLNFGTVALTGNSGTIEVKVDNSVVPTNVSILAPASRGIVKYAPTLGGLISLVINFSAQDKTVYLTGPGGNISVTNFTLNPKTITLNLLNPTVNVNIGGVLNIPSSAYFGDYTGIMVFLGNSTLIFNKKVNVPISVKILKQIAITQISKMDFGAVTCTPSANGSVELNPLTGNKSIIGSGMSLDSSTGSLGVFSVTGSPLTTVKVEVSDTLLLNNSKGATISVTLLKRDAAVQQTLDTSGSLNLYYGGKFQITPATQTGTYTGTYSVKVYY